MSDLMLAALGPSGVVMTIIGLGGLIFFHELGHFLACRLTGTRVEAFSIGFGKEIFGWTRRGTRFRVGMIPLGGYVKMAAENPGEQRSNAPDEFPNKPFSARLFIMSAGVLFNLILAFILFAWAFGIGVPLQRKIGTVMPGSAAWRAGLQPGDIVTHYDGREVLDLMDLMTEDVLAGGKPAVLTVDRNGQRLEIAVSPEEGEGGLRGIMPAVREAAEEVAEGSPVAKSGGRPGDVLLAVNGEAVRTPDDVEPILPRLAALAPEGATSLDLVVRVRRSGGAVEEFPVKVDLVDRPLIGISPYEGVKIEGIAHGTRADQVFRKGDELVRLNDIPVHDLQWLREGPGTDPVIECVVMRDGKEVMLPVPVGTTIQELALGIVGKADVNNTLVTPRPGGPAARAGVRPGDRIVSVAGTAVTAFQDASKAIQTGGMRPIELEIERGTERLKFTIDPVRSAPREQVGTLGYRYTPLTTDYRETNVFRAAGAGWKRTVRFIETTVMTVKGLVTRRVSSEHISGPIMLVAATYRMFDQGFGLYLHILGLISVNLAILNLLPIPILDGGQIVLLIAEKLRGKPLPERVIGYLQMAGLVLILGLLVLAFRNDITRFFF